MNKLKRLFCFLNLHNYEKFQEGTTIYCCRNCKKFKIGPAIDSDGLEMFVFADGSCIKKWRDKI